MFLRSHEGWVTSARRASAPGMCTWPRPRPAGGQRSACGLQGDARPWGWGDRPQPSVPSGSPPSSARGPEPPGVCTGTRPSGARVQGCSTGRGEACSQELPQPPEAMSDAPLCPAGCRQTRSPAPSPRVAGLRMAPPAAPAGPRTASPVWVSAPGRASCGWGPARPRGQAPSPPRGLRCRLHAELRLCLTRPGQVFQTQSTWRSG